MKHDEADMPRQAMAIAPRGWDGPLCPHCNEPDEDLPEEGFGPWLCKFCGKPWSLYLDPDTGEIFSAVMLTAADIEYLEQRGARP